MLFGKYVNKFYIKYGYLFLIGIATLVFIDYVQLDIPVHLGNIVDMFENGSIAGKESEIIKIVIDVLVIAIIMFLGRIIWRVSIFRASTNIAASLRHEMFFKAERLSQSYYHTNKVGTVINWFTTDVDSVEEFFGWGMVMAVDAFFMTILGIVKMAKLNWVLTLIACVPILLIMVWGLLAEKFMRIRWRERQTQTDKLYDFSQENFTGLRVIKAFVKETQQLYAFAKVARKNKDMSIRYVRLSVIFEVSVSVIIATVTSLILGFGGWFVYAAVTGNPVVLFGMPIEITAGELVTYSTYFDFLVWPMMALGQIFSMRSRAKASLNRITAFLDQKEEVNNPTDAIVLEQAKGEIVFNDLSFVYPDGIMPSLKNINCKINAGETIGIVGKIGSGKTTLVNSLLRLYNLEPNKILIDGVDIMKLNIQSLRDVIGYVPQENFLFSDKISNNIAFANKEIEEDSIIEAAKFADVHDNIVNFKDGYETISGERGVTLSGGQKQRISIARAYIKDAPIMIMDDSVSAVDIKTEENILKNIQEKRKGKTTIIVASRISTVKHLDRIMVLNDGALEAFGTHDELVKSSKTYSKLVYLQQLEEEVNGGQVNERE